MLRIILLNCVRSVVSANTDCPSSPEFPSLHWEGSLQQEVVLAMIRGLKNKEQFKNDILDCSFLCHLKDLKNENMLDLLYHLYERIMKYKLTHFSGAIIELILLPKENKYFSKADESL